MWHTFDPGSFGTAVFLGTGATLFFMSVPWSTSFHKTFTAVAFVMLGVSVVTGRFDVGMFLNEMPAYFGIVAVLLVLSAAGYPIRAARYESQIQALMAALTRRGVGVKATSGVLGHVLGAVLDVGSFVLVDVITHRAAPKERVEALKWAGRGFSFAPLWTNLNLLTATTVTLTAVSYPNLLAVTLPFVFLGLGATLLVAQRQGGVVENPQSASLNRGAVAVLLYPVLLVTTVALVNILIPKLPLTATIAVTVAVVVVLIALLATALTRRASPLVRLRDETRGALTASHSEFALFGSAGVLVISLEALGALAPLGSLLSGLPDSLVAPVLAAIMVLGFIAGIHVIPMVLLLNAAFPLDAGPAPVLWAAAILIGSQAALLVTPFSSSVTMLSRLSGMHPVEMGPRRNWRFGVAVASAGAAYIALLTFMLL